MNKHTPGPWRVQNATDVFSALGAESGDGMPADSNDGWLIADCGLGAAICGGYITELGYAVKQANARLIASAPELLQTLKAAMAFINANVADPDLTCEMTDRWMELQALKPESVIAKATGESA